MDLHFFDPHDSFTVLERRLPHWSQAGVVTFLTFRTRDSIPRDVLNRFHADRRNWLRMHRINPERIGWRDSIAKLNIAAQVDFYRKFSTRWNEELDRSSGACVLAQPELSKIVADSLLHFDNDRYAMTDFVVMPNHVHLLAAFPDDQSMLSQCESWKHFTATQINRQLSVKGKFWQQDGFDHLVRSVEQFEHLGRYIRDNPSIAGCGPGETRHYSRPK